MESHGIHPHIFAGPSAANALWVTRERIFRAGTDRRNPFLFPAGVAIQCGFPHSPRALFDTVHENNFKNATDCNTGSASMCVSLANGKFDTRAIEPHIAASKRTKMQGHEIGT